MTLKAGEFYFYAWHDDETGKVEIDRVGCRVVRKGRAYMTDVLDCTWGKRSRRHGDFGWLDPTPVWTRKRVKQGEPEARRFALTKAAAIRAAIANERCTRQFWKERGKLTPVTESDAAIAALQRRLKRAS